MATTGGIPDSDSVTLIINTLAKSLKPLYISLIITCIWSAMLVPLFVVLLFFSNRDLRRKPVFLGNVFAMCLGIVFAGVVLTLYVEMLENPLVPPSKPLSLTFATFMAFNPLLVESVLLTRLYTVYPLKTTPRKIFFGIFIPIILFKIGRAANLIIVLINFSRRISEGQYALLLMQEIWTKFPGYKIEWFLQIVDNTSVSILFLRKLNKGRGLRKSVLGRDLGSAMEALFWIALSNFVIPVVLSIAQLIVIWLTNDIFNAVNICIVNIYIEILGLLFATVWTAGTKWRDNEEWSRSGLGSISVDIGIDATTAIPLSSSKEMMVM